MTVRFRLFSGFLAVVIALIWAWMAYERDRVRTLTVAAGPRDGEAYVLMEALADVVDRHAPRIDLVVLETQGTGINYELLSQGSVDLAAVQGNLPPSSVARLVARLYPDAFQLVARDEAAIETVSDLRGKKIALPPRGSGQYDSFWFLAAHYGLKASDFEARPMSSESANWAMLSQGVDAVFRVRAPGNASVRELIETSPSRVVPIEQAEAMRLQQPAIEAGMLPKGSYRGWPTLPERDLETAVVQRLLVAHEDLDPALVNTLTALLFERRRELVDRTPLAGFIARPEEAGGTFMPLHEGAEQYFQREEPGFLQENAEPIALGVTLLILLGSGVLQLLSQRKKRRIDRYNNEVLVLYNRARESANAAELRDCRDEMMGILGRVVDDAEEGRVTGEGFDLFSFTWGAVTESMRELGQTLRGDATAIESTGRSDA